jgi:hypothetical protein
MNSEEYVEVARAAASSTSCGSGDFKPRPCQPRRQLGGTASAAAVECAIIWPLGRRFSRGAVATRPVAPRSPAGLATTTKAVTPAAIAAGRNSASSGAAATQQSAAMGPAARQRLRQQAEEKRAEGKKRWLRATTVRRGSRLRWGHSPRRGRFSSGADGRWRRLRRKLRQSLGRNAGLRLGRSAGG